MRISVMNAVIATMAILYGVIPTAGWFVSAQNAVPPIVVALDYLDSLPPDCLTDEQCSAE